MARKTDGEKIDELTKTTAALEEGLKAANLQLNAIYDAHSKTAETLANLRREHEKEIALLKHEVDDLKKWKEEQKKERDELSRRLWAFGPNAIGAVINVLLAAIVAYLVAKR